MQVLMRSAGTANWPSDHALHSISKKVSVGDLDVVDVVECGGMFLYGEIIRAWDK